MILLASSIAIGYDDAGVGLPVVFLHGFPHNRSLWAPQLHGLAAPCRTLAFDLRGFGESSVLPPFSMDQYADDIASALIALDTGPAVIAGLSMGGYVALALWRRHPELVRALILSNTRAGADDAAGIAKRKAMIDLARKEGAGPIADQMIGGMVGKTTRDKHPDLVHTMHAMMERSPVEGIAGALQAMYERPDSTPTLATITVPTLVIVGEEDALTPPKEARALHAAIAGSRLEVIAGAGHVSNVERPAAWNHVASEFLTALISE
ncbi:MAG: Pimeloyl-ACP methyl ester carboxylesterase [Verrucomicrobia bacterium]|nr:MAG: Pimeloyl-ACP methyl ester carboxylesterase [Verrucomicrobiota bacterium]